MRISPRPRRSTIPSPRRRSATTSSARTARSVDGGDARESASPSTWKALFKFAGPGLSPAARAGGARRGCSVTTVHVREKSGLTHEEAMRDSIVRVLVSPEFSYRIDLVDTAKKSAPAPKSVVPAKPLSHVRAREPVELLSLVHYARRGVAPRGPLPVTCKGRMF